MNRRNFNRLIGLGVSALSIPPYGAFLTRLKRASIPPSVYIQAAIAGMDMMTGSSRAKIERKKLELLLLISRQLGVINDKLDLIFEGVQNLPEKLQKVENEYALKTQLKRYRDVLNAAAEIENRRSRGKYVRSDSTQSELSNIRQTSRNASDTIISNGINDWTLIPVMTVATGLEIDITRELNRSDVNLSKEKVKGLRKWLYEVCFTNQDNLEKQLKDLRASKDGNFVNFLRFATGHEEAKKLYPDQELLGLNVLTGYQGQELVTLPESKKLLELKVIEEFESIDIKGWQRYRDHYGINDPYNPNYYYPNQSTFSQMQKIRAVKANLHLAIQSINTIDLYLSQP